MPTRRTFLATGTSLAASAWLAPSVTSLDRVAAASPSSICEVPSTFNGAVWLNTPPTSLLEGGPLDSNSNTFVFAESGPVLLTNDLTVNRTTAGDFGGDDDEQATIAAGTWICSYLVHGDRRNDNGTLTGGLLFPTSRIIGLIYRTNELMASAFLQNPNTIYDTGQIEPNETVTFDGVSALTWTMIFGPHLDQIRVITDCPV